MVEKAEDKKRKVLVTGSNGMLGVDLCHQLSRDYDIVGLDIGKSPVTSGLAPVYIPCDIRDKDKVIESVTKAHPDLIVHTAALTDVDGCERDPERAEKINREGTANVVVSASNLKVPFIYISTDFVFDGSKDNPYTEDDQPNPLSVYARTKYEGEKIVSALKNYIIIRTSWLYGANGKNFVDTILEKAQHEKTLKVVDDQCGSPTYTKDLAKAIYKLLDTIWGLGLGDRGQKSNERDRIYHICNKGTVSWFDYTKEILQMAGLDNIEVVPIKSNQLGRPARRPRFSALDTSYFEGTTGYVVRSWQDALKEYVNEKK